MTANKAIEIIDRIKPNAYTDETKYEWIAELDGKISLEIIKNKTSVTYDFPNDGDKQLIAKEPYANIYELYISSMIDFYNREYSNYQNSVAMFNAAFDDYAKQYIRSNSPSHTAFHNY